MRLPAAAMLLQAIALLLPSGCDAGKDRTESLLATLKDTRLGPEARARAAQDLGKASGGPGNVDPVVDAALLEITRDFSAPRRVRLAALHARAELKGVKIHDFSKTAGERGEPIDLPQGAPHEGPVLPGTYLFSIRVEIEDGPLLEDKVSCALTLLGDSIAWVPEGRGSTPIRGTLVKGLLEAVHEEPGGAFLLKGQVTAPGKLAGAMTCEPSPGAPRVKEGRWSLVRQDQPSG